MSNFNQHKKELHKNGFSVIDGIFNEVELMTIVKLIEDNNFDFSERQLINKFPKLQEMVFGNKLFKGLYNTICDENYFLSKAIYFNKPSKSNWFVSYHQDLSVSVKEKNESEGFNNWTNKKGQLGVIPPLNILEETITFRIHIDNTNVENGALKVISESHNKGIIRIDEDFQKFNYGNEAICDVKSGGVMLMKPLILHASQKSVSDNERRVIHLEFCNQEIPMRWLEKRKIS
jgi:hypothetical protein